MVRAEREGDPEEILNLRKKIRAAERHENAKQVSKALLMMSHPDWKQRVKACRLIAEKDSSNISSLVEDGRLGSLMQDIEPSVRAAALVVIQHMGAKALPLASQIVKRLEDSDWQVREAAAKALGCIGEGARTVSVQVAHLMRHTDRRTQLAAVEACAEMGASAGAAAEQIAGLLEAPGIAHQNHTENLTHGSLCTLGSLLKRYCNMLYGLRQERVNG